MMDADVVGHNSLQQGQNRAANNGRHHQAGALIGQPPQFGQPQRKDVRPHDGVEKSHQYQALHRQMAEAKHGSHNQAEGNDGRHSQHRARAQLLRNSCDAQPANHRAAPIERDIDAAVFSVMLPISG